MKIKYLFLLIVGVISMLLLIASCADPSSASNIQPSISDKPLPAVMATGTNLSNRDGNIVKFRGVNLGGWLVFEEWMCPIYDNKDTEPKAAGTDIYNILLSRFSEEEVNTLIETYQNNWITEYDLNYLQSIGVNCVRVPFWYRNFQNADGSWKYTADGEIDFGRLDWVVDQCGKRGIYVILDLHGAPGAQSISHHSGANNSCHLFDNTPEGEAYREQTVFLWKALASHYNGCTTVAAFDLLNEPYCDMTLDAAAYNNINHMYDMLYQAVREVNTSTIIVMEAMWRLDRLPAPEKMGWENVMYEVHYYGCTHTSDINEGVEHLKKYSELYQVPVYVGEFACDTYEAYAIASYAKASAGYTTWTYKGSHAIGQWFLRYSEKIPSANIVTDSYDEILEKWGKQIQTEYESKNVFGWKKTKLSYDVNTTIEQAIIASSHRSNTVSTKELSR